MTKTADLISQALSEDHVSEDITTLLTVSEDQETQFWINSRDEVVICGTEIAKAVFQQVDPRVEVELCHADGIQLEPGECLIKGRGPSRAILSAERTALNFLQYLSGIATETRKYVGAVQGTKAVILDTRKTLPGYRALAKEAVRAGGGNNHRMGLHDAVMIKDNHIALCGGDLRRAIAQVKAGVAEGVLIEVECDTLEQVTEAMEAGAERLLLDNMSCEKLRQAVRLVGGRVPLEASGNVRLDTVREIAETGVDFISVGRLTHSVRSVDIGLDMSPALPAAHHKIETETSYTDPDS